MVAWRCSRAIDRAISTMRYGVLAGHRRRTNGTSNLGQADVSANCVDPCSDPFAPGRNYYFCHGQLPARCCIGQRPSNAVMLILRGIASAEAPRGQLDDDSALKYARRVGYRGEVLDVASN